jgi:hypothetical protein
MQDLYCEGVLLVALVAVFTPVYGPRGVPRWSFNSMLHQEANPSMVAAKAAARWRRCNRPVLTLQDARTNALLPTGRQPAEHLLAVCMTPAR